MLPRITTIDGSSCEQKPLEAPWSVGSLSLPVPHAHIIDANEHACSDAKMFTRLAASEPGCFGFGV